MSNINNSTNVKGMGSILADDDDGDINIDDIEKSIIQGVSVVKRDKPVDLAKEYSKEIEDLGRKFNVSGGKPSSLSSSDDSEDNRGIDDLLQWSPYDKPKSSSSTTKSGGISYNQSSKAPYNVVDDDDDDDSAPTTVQSPMGKMAEWSAGNPDDDQLNRMTNEERKQDHLNKVLGDMDKNNDDAEFLQKEDEEDEMARIMEQIDLLKNNLESEGVDLGRIPDVNTGTSKKEAKAILRILQIKNDRLRYCDFFEEGILAVAYGMEGFFNGQREILGSKIDLTGYSDTVKVKLRRMRYDTSNFVSGIMQGYNISSGWRIMLELIPSLFLYSRDRRLTARDNLISDERYKKAMQDLQ